MNILDLSILQGKLTGSTFTLELLCDKIKKSNPSGHWDEIQKDIGLIIETQKEASKALYNLQDSNQKKDKALNKISFLK